MKTAVLKYFVFAGFAILVFSFTSCSSQESTKNVSDNGDKTFSFYEYEDGYRSHFEVNFDGNKIVSLYKDGKRIPGNEIKNYEDLVFEKLDELNGKSSGKRETVHHFEFDRDKFKEGMKELNKDLAEKRAYIFKFNDSTFFDREKFKKEMKELKKDLSKKRNFYFFEHDSTFNKGMEKMKEELAKLKDIKIDINFDSDELKKDMEKIRIELRDLNINDDLKELNEDLKKMTDEIKELEIDKIEVDIPDIEIDLKELEKELSNFDEEMADLKVDLKKLDSFLKDVRQELVKDELIKSEDKRFSMELKPDGMTINDKDVPEKLLNKYKELYKKHFGKELEDKVNFNIHNHDND